MKRVSFEDQQDRIYYINNSNEKVYFQAGAILEKTKTKPKKDLSDKYKKLGSGNVGQTYCLHDKKKTNMVNNQGTYWKHKTKDQFMVEGECAVCKNKKYSIVGKKDLPNNIKSSLK